MSLNNVYTFNSVHGVFITDAGGIDTINAETAKISAFIDLNYYVDLYSGWGYLGTTRGAFRTDANQITVNPGSVIENAIGGLANDTLLGNSENNILDGRAGADEMRGGKGDDTYYVDNIKDLVVEFSNEGKDKVYSTVSYSLDHSDRAGVDDLELIGNDNINAIGNSLNNTLIGNTGNNVLNGRAGADIMIGGVGNDTYYVDNENDIVIEKRDEGADRVFSTVNYSLAVDERAHIEYLELLGTTNINAIGSRYSNRLVGNSGDNILDGGAGADQMLGGKGNDTYYVDHVDDKIFEKQDEGIDTVYSSVNYSLAGIYVENITLTGVSHLKAIGNSLANTLTGNSGANVLDGGLGADRMLGGKGDDTYYVDDINDKVYEKQNEGTDSVISSVSYSLAGLYVENLTLTGNAHLNATGNSLANSLTGNVGDNILDGGAGVDRMLGGMGNDTYYVDNVNDKIYEKQNEGTDSIISNVSYSLSGIYVENLALTGSAHLNAAGNSFANSLSGNTGHNILEGAGGKDILIGGGGSDTALYNLLNQDATGGNGADTWNDFHVSDVWTSTEADKIDISSLLIGYRNVYHISVLDEYLTVTTNNNDTFIYLDRDGGAGGYADTLFLTLKNVNTSLDELIDNQQFIV